MLRIFSDIDKNAAVENQGHYISRGEKKMPKVNVNICLSLAHGVVTKRNALCLTQTCHLSSV